MRLDPWPVAETNKRVETPLSVMLGLYDYASVVDLSVSLEGFQRGYDEANPIFRGLKDKPILFVTAKLGGILLANVVIKQCWNVAPWVAYVIAAIGILGEGWVDVHNVNLLKH